LTATICGLSTVRRLIPHPKSLFVRSPYQLKLHATQIRSVFPAASPIFAPIRPPPIATFSRPSSRDHSGRAPAIQPSHRTGPLNPLPSNLLCPFRQFPEIGLNHRNSVTILEAVGAHTYVRNAPFAQIHHIFLSPSSAPCCHSPADLRKTASTVTRAMRIRFRGEIVGRRGGVPVTDVGLGPSAFPSNRACPRPTGGAPLQLRPPNSTHGGAIWRPGQRLMRRPTCAVSVRPPAVPTDRSATCLPIQPPVFFPGRQKSSPPPIQSVRTRARVSAVANRRCPYLTSAAPTESLSSRGLGPIGDVVV
jgi:hypothetical protein